MPYRKRTEMAKRLAAAREAQERKRLEGPAPEYPADLPGLRREVIVRDHDFANVEYRFELWRTNRVDCYKLVCDGNMIAERVGWARALEIIRKGFVRVRAV